LEFAAAEVAARPFVLEQVQVLGEQRLAEQSSMALL
jgi:hypothetical protein